jgi:hypothetical protein
MDGPSLLKLTPQAAAGWRLVNHATLDLHQMLTEQFLLMWVQSSKHAGNCVQLSPLPAPEWNKSRTTSGQVFAHGLWQPLHRKIPAQFCRFSVEWEGGNKGSQTCEHCDVRCWYTNATFVNFTSEGLTPGIVLNYTKRWYLGIFSFRLVDHLQLLIRLLAANYSCYIVVRSWNFQL